MNATNGSDPDEISTGFGAFGPAAVALLTIALTTWPLAFNLGAYDAVFYMDVFQIVVVSTVGFALSVIRPVYEGATRWLARAALAAPFAWMALAVVLFDSLGDATSNAVFGIVGLVIAIVSVPVVLSLLLHMFTPDITEARDRRLVGGAVAVVLLTAVVGFAVGRNNDAFLTCDDFKIAGSDQPKNCAAE